MNDIKINIFCKKLSAMYHKIVGISDNTILIHFQDNDIQLFNKEISGYIFIETLQNIIFLEVEWFYYVKNIDLILFKNVFLINI